MRKILIMTVVTFLLTAVAALAAPKIDIELIAEVDLKEIVDGKEVITRVPATEAAPGQTIYYTLTYTNSGDQPATGVKLNDPIPKETIYVSASAFGNGATITYSADDGLTYQEETRVTYKTIDSDGSVSEKTASPEQYTHIRWTLDTIPAGVTGTVGFKARVQ